jgi:bifunctional enzyme CysN/CysC
MLTRRSIQMSEIHPQHLEIDRQAREALKQQRARCFWFTGLPAAGKSTIANLLDRRLHAAGRHSYVLDGDNIRQGLSRDLDFTHAARAENIRRVAEVARLMLDAGLIVIAAFISPFRAEREFARSLFERDRFIEVFIDAPLAECERRDPKGLYAKARSGALRNFTGYESPYEPPEHPDIRIDTMACTASDAAARLAIVAERWS